MTSAAREILRQNLLQQLAAVSPQALPLAPLSVGARIGGFTVTVDVLVAELAYLVDKRLAVEADKHLSPENKEWRITADGRDYLAMHGL